MPRETTKPAKEEPKETKEFSATYQELAKTHKLPPYETLTADFDIDTIDAGVKHPLKEVARKMFEHIDMFKKIFEGMLQPDASVLTMQEAEHLTDADFTFINGTLRTLMHLDRLLLDAELHNDDARYAAFITAASKDWQVVKKQLAPVIARMQDSWKNHHAKKDRAQQYLG